MGAIGGLESHWQRELGLGGECQAAGGQGQSAGCSGTSAGSLVGAAGSWGLWMQGPVGLGTGVGLLVGGVSS